MTKHTRLAVSALSLMGGAILALSAPLPAFAGHAEHAPMTALDLVTMPQLGSPIVSPNERRVIYRVTTTDADSFDRTSAYYMLDLSNPAPKPVKLALEDAHSLQWGAQGTLYYVGYADDEATETIAPAQIYSASVNADGSLRKTRQISAFHADIGGFKVSPDESRIAVWANLARACKSLLCQPSETGAGVGNGRLYEGDAGFVRHWDKWKTPGNFNRVFVHNIIDGIVAEDSAIPLDGSDAETGLTGDTPTMPFGGGEDIVWAPDSSGVYFTARVSDAKEPVSTDLDIYWSDLSGSAPTVLTGANDAHDSQPAPSHDGKTLAYLAMARPGYESDKLTIHLRDVETGTTRALTKQFDRSFGSLAWSADGQSLLATAADVLDTPVFKVDVQSGSVTKLDLMAGNEAHIANVTPLADGGVLFTRDSIGAPHELYLSESGNQARPLTDAAMSKVGALASTVTTRFSFPGANGDTVWGQITKLEDQEGPIPAILYIHGGPQGSFRDGWSSRWNPRVVASQGYAVISVDFHGSAGYGQEFMDSINRDWGGKPLEDLQKGLAAALERDPQIDGSRACAMGASYGGYMVNWIAGKWPERFNCLVQHDGLFDMRSFYYSTEELWFPRWDFGGSYTEAREEYERWNPVNHIDQWQTPMLVITGEKDFRVPYTQGVQSFTVLQERGIPSQLLVFPEENHWVLGKKNSLQWHNTVFDWLDRWLVEDGADEAAE